MMSDEVFQEPQEPATVGQRLARAREAAGMALGDVASRTRIPIRHLQHIEAGEWDALPAPTYAVGFVRAYAGAVGLDGAELGREVRQQLGGVVRRAPAPEYYEPADPARVPPRSLALIAALIAIALVVGYAIWRSSLGDGGQAPAATSESPVAPAPAPPPPAAPATPAAVAGQPVTLISTGEVWLRVTDGPNGASLFQGTLNAGQTFAVPPTAQHPLLRTGRPQLLRVTIGTRDLGPLEPTEHTVNDVSLLAQDLAARPAPSPGPTPPSAAPLRAPPAQPSAIDAPPATIPVAPGAEPLNPPPGPAGQ